MADTVTFKVVVDDRDWLAEQARREGLSAGQLVRKLIDAYRTQVQDTEVQNTEIKETPMGRPKTGSWNNQPFVTPKKKKFSASNPLPAELRIEPPRTVCPRCSADCWADSDGNPKPHLRQRRPGDANYTPELVTMTDCRDE